MYTSLHKDYLRKDKKDITAVNQIQWFYYRLNFFIVDETRFLNICRV